MMMMMMMVAESLSVAGLWGKAAAVQPVLTTAVYEVREVYYSAR